MLTKRYLDDDVVSMAKKRIITLFNTGMKVSMSFSGGKDSIVLADIVLKLIAQGKINKEQLIVEFIDEEGMFDDVIEMVKKWRVRFMSEGIPFHWYCLPVKHFNCLNTLSEDETFICWDPNKKDVWIREMPDFAIKDHPLLIPRKDNYQAFMSRLRNFDGRIGMTGVRCSESVQRLRVMANQKSFITNNMCKPIYDMTDKDVWLYIYKYGLELPVAYENMYRTGASKRDLRISQFFSIDTAKHLVNMAEMYPDLMDKIVKREPNAYLCSLYWDTEMFGRNTKKRRDSEADEDRKDYRKEVYRLIHHPELLENDNQRKILRHFKKVIVSDGDRISDRTFRRMYGCIFAGDPKARTQRSIMEQLLHELKMSVQDQKRKGEL